MNAKKAKAIRRAMKNETVTNCTFVAHPDTYTNTSGSTLLRYRFQYLTTGKDKLIKVAKKIYDISGVLPRRQNG